MKSLIKALSFAAILGFFATSCNTDPCKDVVCGTNGSCTEGVCNCETGYEKDAAGLCNVEASAKFVGTWTATDACSSSGPASYSCPVTRGGVQEIRITNFWGSFTNQAVATVSGADFKTLNIARQSPDNDNFFIVGTGTINAAGNSITWSYTITDETDPASIVTDACTSNWVK